MLLRFGPLRLSLHASERWLELAAQRYGNFADESGAAIGGEIRVDYEAAGNGPTMQQLSESMLGPIEMQRAESSWRLRAPGVVGSMDEKFIRLRGPLATFPLDSAMIALWSLAGGSNAAVVHGALLAEGDRGWLCTGPSGVGKSTLAALLPRRSLCDELMGVRIESGELVAYSLPFWRGRPGRVRLEGVHFLAHGAMHERHELTIDQSFSRIHSQILWPSWCRPSMAGAFRVAAALAHLPSNILSFRPEASVWPHLAVGLDTNSAGARAS